MNCLVLPAIAVIAVALASAQTEGQTKRTIGRPVGGGSLGAGTKYLYAYATPDPNGPTVHCKGDGIDCVVNARLLQPVRLTPVHDATLQQATAEANRILEQLHRSGPEGKALCLYRSIYGPVLIWREAESPAAAASARPANAVTKPEAIAGLLGIQPAHQRQVAGGAGGGTLEAELIWDDGLKHYVWSCTKPGNNCVIHGALGSAAARTVFDATLARATQELNSLFERTAARAPRPGVRLCLLFLPAGPVLVWSSDGTRSYGASQRTITSDNPDFDRLAREALGLN